MKTAYFFYVDHFTFGGIGFFLIQNIWSAKNIQRYMGIIKTHDIRIHFLYSIANSHIRSAYYLLDAKLVYNQLWLVEADGWKKMLLTLVQDDHVPYNVR